VTSAQPLEGKTIVAANMAMALAYGGARVLLIDADVRRPGLHRPLRLKNERGLAQVLNGQARVRDVLQRTVDANLLAITAGATPPNPSELLSSARMKTLLDNLTHGPFDWILIDTPPVLAVSDAVVLAPPRGWRLLLAVRLMPLVLCSCCSSLRASIPPVRLRHAGLHTSVPNVPYREGTEVCVPQGGRCERIAAV